MQSLIRKFITACRNAWSKLKSVRFRINRLMSGKSSDKMMALLVTLVSMIIMIIALFIPPYIGVANDGTVSETMRTVGLDYISDSVGDNYNNYFVRTYKNVYANRGSVTVHTLFVRFARFVDYIITGDAEFDVRFLAIIYVLLYIPAIFILVNSALKRLSYFTEKTVVSVLSVMVFADISLISYFNSLYAEPIVLIGLTYMIGSAMSLQYSTKYNSGYIIIFTVWAAILGFTRRHLIIITFIAALFIILLLKLKLTMHSAVIPVISCVLLAMSLIAYTVMPNDFTDTSKIHSMTRGVLLQSSNPEKTLSEFGIDGSYAILADVSLYDLLPITDEENPLMHEQFIDKYSSIDVLLHYMRHPGAFISMLDIGVKSSFNLNRTFCGNYEKSTGMPPRAQSVFWSAYSIYKVRSAPKTIGYLVLMIAAYIMLSGKRVFSVRDVPDRFHYIYFVVMTFVVLVGVVDISYIIIHSGDAQLQQFNFALGICMDFLFYFVLTEILYKLNILEKSTVPGEEEKNYEQYKRARSEKHRAKK